LSLAAGGVATATAEVGTVVTGKAAPSLTWVTPVVPVAGAPAGFKVPAGSCLAQRSPSCPRVSSVDYIKAVQVFQTRSTSAQPADGPTDIAPDTDFYGAFVDTSPQQGGVWAATAADATKKSVGACQLDAPAPSGYSSAVDAEAAISCGATVTYAEVDMSLQRYRHGWENLMATSNYGYASPTEPAPYATTLGEYNCHHYKTYPYRTDDFGYFTDSLGHGHTFEVHSGKTMETCPDLVQGLVR
jgi:hypothetical protein